MLWMLRGLITIVSTFEYMFENVLSLNSQLMSHAHVRAFTNGLYIYGSYRDLSLN